MKNRITIRREGSALLTITVLLMAASIFASTMLRVSLSRTFMARKLAARTKAGVIAEAGVSAAYSMLARDFSQRTNTAAFPQTAYGGGVYDTTVTDVGNGRVNISCTGMYDSVEQIVMLDVIQTPDTDPSSPSALKLDYAILAGGKINWTGSSAFHGSVAVHSNGKFTRSGAGLIGANVSSSTAFQSNGNAGGIDGNVTAPVLTGNLSGNTGSNIVASVPLVEIPNIDLTPYYNQAMAHGEVFNGNLTLSSSYAPNGGVLWVLGDLSLAGGAADFVGCFIATGDISISGGGSVRKVDNYPVLASRDGDIHFTGTKDLEGLVYVKMGDYRHQAGNNVLAGQYIVCGDFSKAGGSSTEIFYTDYILVPPGASTPGTQGSLYVTAWQ